MDQLHRLSCPFTWEMKNVVSTPESLLLDYSQSESNWNIETDKELGSFTLMKLMYSVMVAFENAEKGGLKEAMQKIKESEEIFIKLQSMPNGISIKAVDHIIKSTKCFILKEMKRFSDVTNILKSIDSCDKEKLEIGTLYGCQSIAWSFYFAAECDKAIQNASRAIDLNSDNGLWHFILGKSLRRQRKFFNFGTKLTLREQTSFKNAFDLLPTNPYVGIYCAQMYRESYDLKNAKRAYTKVLAMKPDSCDIYLKLALGFIRTKSCEKASECLKYVASRTPKDKTYLHYIGIYLEKCEKDYKKFHNVPLTRFKINIFDVLKREVIPLWKKQAVDQSTREMLREAEEACNEYNARFSKTTAQKMTKDSL
ncbi:uncharacterized protein LOC107266175 isoform X2 [Cephus cinctus]|uniref:Uncharacterized protein LOC107266175 isoform X2 n=1 Tax=Cephus cinctus TaxID=211228 RepID=A0AAJ7BRL8_CEPCN|nr:uncharacterized protein LOC107266175 isoform X2 [Cephus cinctus]